MPTYTTADIRNVLLAGHGGCGKTTLADALLFASGTVNRKASVADGSSFSDFEKEEKEHKHSIYPAVLHADHAGKRINLIDTPGSPDLIGPAHRLPAGGRDGGGRHQRAERHRGRHPPDHGGRQGPQPAAGHHRQQDATCPRWTSETLVEQIRETFGPECLPINLPAGGGKAVVDCLLSTEGDERLRHGQALPRRHPRPDRRDGREPDGEVPRRRGAGLHRPARPVREGDGRGARGADPLHRRQDRRRRPRAARRDRPPLPQPAGGQPPRRSSPAPAPATTRTSGPSSTPTTRPSRCWPTCSR